MPQPPEVPTMYTLDEVAKVFKISRSHAYRLKKQQAWPHHKLGTEIRFSLENIEAIRKMNERKPVAEAPVKRAPRIGTRATKKKDDLSES